MDAEPHAVLHALRVAIILADSARIPSEATVETWRESVQDLEAWAKREAEKKEQAKCE